MKARIMLVALAALSLFGSTNAFARHDQGCKPLLPAFGNDCWHDWPDDDEPIPLSGCAYTAYADVTAPVVGNVKIGNETAVNFRQADGTEEAAVSAPCPIDEGPHKETLERFGFTTPAGSPVGGTVSVLRSTVDAEPAGFPSGGYSLASATIANLRLSVPSASLSIRADVIRAVAFCSKVARGPGRDDLGPAGFGAASIVGLTISHPSFTGGSLSIPVVPGEDTWISLPGVGGIMLRETWDLENPPAPGNTYKSFTENMIHVYLTGLVTGDIVISQAHCDGENLTGRPGPDKPR